MKKIKVFSHMDLDGIGSYMMLCWAFPKAIIDLQPTTVQLFREHFISWLANDEISNYDKVFILDLDVSQNIDLVDNSNIFIIDHHKSHVLNNKYKKAKCLISEYSSATKLIYKAFVKLYKLKLTNSQKTLVALIDDYDSYELKVPDSKNLNIVFWGTDNKFVEFPKSFIGGFNGFNYKQQNMIKLYYINLEEIKSKIEVYAGTIKVQGKDRKVCSAMATSSINDVADILLTHYDANIAIVINAPSGHISFRKSTKEYDKDLDLSKFAKTIADGAGHEYASGGNITETFTEFCKILKPIA